MQSLRTTVIQVALIVAVLGGLYLLALHKHAERDALRHVAVDLTPACREKVENYGLRPGERYRSPYLLKTTGK